MEIYASLKVPEVWRYARQKLRFHFLGKERRYRVREVSRAFPGLRPEHLMQFLAMRDHAVDIVVIRRFREWVRQQIAAGVLTRPIF